MVTTDNIDNIMVGLGFKKINHVFLDPNNKIIATKLVANSLLFSWNGKKEKIIFDDNFKNKVCDILNSVLRDKLSKILNKLSK